MTMKHLSQAAHAYAAYSYKMHSLFIRHPQSSFNEHWGTCHLGTLLLLFKDMPPFDTSPSPRHPQSSFIKILHASGLSTSFAMADITPKTSLSIKLNMASRMTLEVKFPSSNSIPD